MVFNYGTLSLSIVIASTFSRGCSTVESVKKPNRIWSWRDRTENLRYLKCIMNLAAMELIAEATKSLWEIGWLNQNFVLAFQAQSTVAIGSHLIILQDVETNLAFE